MRESGGLWEMLLRLYLNLLLPRRYCRLSGLTQSVKNSYTTVSSGEKCRSLPDGVWPTMITPFLNDTSKSVDWRSLDCEERRNEHTQHVTSFPQW